VSDLRSKEDARLADAAIGAIAALALVAFATLSWLSYREYESQHREERETAANHRTDHRAEQGEAFCVEIPRQRARACVMQPPEPDADAKQAEYDLRAQQDMAQWAYAMFLATVAGLFVTAVGLIYVVRAFRLNAIATEHAANAADSAARANEHFVESVRAHVAIMNVGMTAQEGMPDALWVTIKNVGQSRASAVRIADHTWFGPPDDEAEYELEETGVLDLAPGQEFTESMTKLDPAKIAIAKRLLQEGKRGAFFVMGRLDYTDMLGRSQFTKFRFRADTNGGGRFEDGSMKICRTGNESS
jgi:hypothetical protein